MTEDVFIERIDSFGYDGEGVARLNGEVVFIPRTLKGELVKGVITQENSSFLRAEPLEILEKSDKRIPAPCPYYGRCGGCQYQHTIYENELEIKRDLLAWQLKKVGYAGEINVTKSPEKYGYRNKIRLFVSEDGLGLKERSSHVNCNINSCLLVSPRINETIKAINKFLLGQNLCHVYNEVIIREEGEGLAVVFVCKMRNTKVDYQGIYLILGSNCGIFESYNDILTHKVGIKTLDGDELGLKTHFSPLSFHQVNRFLGEKIYKFVIGKVVGKRVANCYSGAGVLSGIIAQKDKQVIGIELGKSEHDDAEKMKEENGLFLLTNVHGDCADVLKTIADLDTIVVDPPRKGMDKRVVESIISSSAIRLIYISCNSATLVRDVQRMTNFAIKSVTLFDMFARTGEYEVVMILDRKD